jgi:stress-induced morphogen
MAITPTEVENIIRQSFPDAQITVQSNDNVHFAAEIIDESFRGQNRVQQQRAVNAALKDYISGSDAPIHALALTTKAPE